MGTQIDKIRHGCGDKQALAVFAHEDGTIDGYCFACGTAVKDPMGEGKQASDFPVPAKKTPEEIEAELAEISTYPTVDLPYRRLRKETLQKFGVKVALSESDGKTPVASYWPVTIDRKFTGYHVKTANGRPFNVGITKGADLLNWDNAISSGAHTLIITEGPEDMAAVDKIYELHHSDPDYFPAIVSLPHGAGSARAALTKHAADIRRVFRRVLLSFDDDDVGREAVNKAMLILPDALSVTLPCKDANECIMKGRAKAAYKAFAFQATAPKNTNLIRASTLHEAARVPPTYGEWSWPWPKMNKALRGMRHGETIYVGAGQKMGKGEFRNSVIAHLMKEHDAKIMLASFEEPPTKSYKLINGKLAGKIFHDPEKEFDYEAFDEFADLMSSNLLLIDRYQRAKWNQVKEDVITAHEWGARGFFIDPITNFTNGIDPAEANTFLQGMAQEASELAADLDSVFFFFCHLKANDSTISAETRKRKYDERKYWKLGNCSHQRGGDIYSDQFTGSRAMARSCNLMIGIEGNKDPELPLEIRNTRNVTILEEREFGTVGDFPLYWNENTGQFTEGGL